MKVSMMPPSGREVVAPFDLVRCDHGGNEDDEIGDGRHGQRRGRGVQVVFTQEDYRQFPDGGQIDGLVKGTLIAGAVTEERYGDPVIPLKMTAQGRSHGGR